MKCNTSNYYCQYQQHKTTKLTMCDKELQNIFWIGIAHIRYPFKTYWQLKTDYNHYQYSSSLNMLHLTWKTFHGPKHFIRIFNKYELYKHYKTNLYNVKRRKYYILCIKKDSYKNICQIGTHSLNFLAPQKCDIYVE